MSVVSLSGRLSQDGKLTEFTNKHGAVGHVYRNTIAVQTRQEITKPDRNTGELVKDKLVTFMPFVVWGDRAKIFAGTQKKGNMVHITGELMPREVQRQDGTQYRTFEVKVDGLLNENQARDLNDIAFRMTHPNYVRQQELNHQFLNNEENDFGDYDEGIDI